MATPRASSPTRSSSLPSRPEDDPSSPSSTAESPATQPLTPQQPGGASYAAVAASNSPAQAVIAPVSPGPSASGSDNDMSGTTPIASAAQHLTTPPSQARVTSVGATASPVPTSSPTPNPHRRNHSAASSSSAHPSNAPISAVSSPARREFTPGDISDTVLHEESGEEEEDAAAQQEREGEDLFSAGRALKRAIAIVLPGLRSTVTSDGEEQDDEDGWAYAGPGRALSPALVQRGREGERKDDDGSDDEVQRLDRGEELVRKRMRERKEARRAARAAQRQQQQQQQARLSSFTSHSHTPSEPSNALGLGYPATSASGGGAGTRARDPSTARSDAYSSVFSDGARSPVHPVHPGAPWSPLPLPTPHGYPTPGARPGMGGRGASYVSTSSGYFPHHASSAPSAGGGSTAPSVIEGSEAGESTAEEADLDGQEGEVGEIVGSHEPRLEDWRDGGADGTHVGGSSDEDDDQDVEYTLKDRQDAFNVEHPFGLPIWKPALYKKDRSIARHAESALHASPSSTALHHLLPANVVWTVVFGVWLFLLCTFVSGVLWVTPWGGGKYGRVVWELGTYLVWPFGKYVEGWTDGGDEIDDTEYRAHDGYATLDEGDEAGEQVHPEAEGSHRYDREAGGRTFPRGRSGTISGTTSTAATTRTHPGIDAVFDGALPDEPLRRSDRTVRAPPSASSLRRAAFEPANERTSLLQQQQQQQQDGNREVQRAHRGYGSASTVTGGGNDKSFRSSSEDTILGGAGQGSGIRPHDFTKDGNPHPFRLRALGRVMYWTTFYGLIAPVMALVCLVCWFFVFTIPMAKLLWVLLRHLNNEPLSLHFRSPREYVHIEQDLENGRDVEGSIGADAGVEHEDVSAAHEEAHPPGSNLAYPLRAGQPAPPISRKSLVADQRKGRLRGPHPTVLLCTYRAAGLEYYKYTVDGVNIWFVNLMSLVFFAIADFFYLEPYVEHHPDASKFLHFVSGQAVVFALSLLSVIPLSYFIGMAVASISAQSSIGMGAVINASFGSVIEIILYSIALTQSKGELVEGSIVGSILAGVLLMPGCSMIGGAVRRKEQRFNAKSAGVTSTMLIMAVIGVLTPTMFYEIYGSFQLTCTGCDVGSGLGGNTAEQCRSCYYEHVSPADDPFYKSTVKYLSYYCAIILVLAYLIGLWFSLRTHASQIWQNAAPAAAEHGAVRPLSGASAQPHPALHERRSLYQRIVPSQLFQPKPRTGPTPMQTPLLRPTPHLPPSSLNKHDPPLELPHGMTQDEFSRAFEVVAAVGGQPLHRASSHVREVSAAPKEHEEEGHGGHDAPNWSRKKSATVLLACTVLYAIIAEILVDVVDVVLDGSGIPEKLLGVTLFALVPNTTEFMNAISFALNGNIALSMEIGSAYALQVCLIQAPAMLAFSAWYGIGRESMAHRAFTLVFPRWDVIAILFSVFLLTYVYSEARSNYFRGSILVLSYLALLGGFAAAPSDRDTSDSPVLLSVANHPVAIAGLAKLKALALTLFSR
ncbi:hypothetical protein JCM10213v2_008186 [Rhodosporidiobolus nylandii]